MFCLYLRVCTPCAWCSGRPEEGAGVPGTEVTVGGELPAAWVLGIQPRSTEGNQCSQPLNQLPAPRKGTFSLGVEEVQFTRSLRALRILFQGVKVGWEEGQAEEKGCFKDCKRCCCQEVSRESGRRELKARAVWSACYQQVSRHGRLAGKMDAYS